MYVRHLRWYTRRFYAGRLAAYEAWDFSSTHLDATLPNMAFHDCPSGGAVSRSWEHGFRGGGRQRIGEEKGEITVTLTLLSTEYRVPAVSYYTCCHYTICREDDVSLATAPQHPQSASLTRSPQRLACAANCCPVSPPISSSARFPSGAASSPLRVLKNDPPCFPQCLCPRLHLHCTAQMGSLSGFGGCFLLVLLMLGCWRSL